MMLGMSTTITAPRKYATVHITSPDVVDIVAQTDQTFILVPKAPGTSSVLILDEKSAPISSISVFVSAPIGPGQIFVHNGARISDAQVFACVPGAGCRFEGDVASRQIPPPPPSKSVSTTDSVTTQERNTSTTHSETKTQQLQ
jgi:hypothetical protein